MSILSQIIAYSPNKIDTETKAKGLLLAEVPRSEMDNFNTPDLDQGADSILRPGETLEDDFDVEFRRPNAQGGRIPFDVGGMAKLVSYVESLPKGTTVTTKMLEDYVKKSKINVNIKNFFDRKAPKIKGYKYDTSFQGSKLTDVEKTNIETFGKAKYDKLSIGDQFRVRRGDDVGKLAPEKQAKQIYKKEYDKAYKFYKDKGLEIDFAAEENIRQNISKNNGKFVTPKKKLKAESGLSSIFKNYDKADLIKDLKKGKDLGEISIEYFDKNEKEILKVLEGKRDYTKPLGRLSTDLGAAIRQDEEATKLYNKIKKKNTFKQLGIKKKIRKRVRNTFTICTRTRTSS